MEKIMSYKDILRNVGNTLSFGAIKSSSEIASAKQAKDAKTSFLAAAKSKKADSIRLNRTTNAARRTDMQQQKNIKALQKDVDRLEKDGSRNYDAATKSSKSLRRQIDRRSEAVDKKIEAIQSSATAQERAAARIGAAMQQAIASAGSSNIDAIYSKIMKDGKITMAELTQLAGGTIQFAGAGFNELRGEIALHEGEIAELEGDIEALNIVTEGIDENARVISGVTSKLTDLGVLDSGDQLNNLANGSVFFRGRRLGIDALMFPLVLLKSSTVYTQFDREDEDFGDWVMSDVDPSSVVLGSRVITTDTAASLASDGKGYGYNTTNSVFETVVKDASGNWPVGSLVEVKGVLKVAPNWESALKVLGSYGITTFDRWYTSLVPLFSEKLGSFLGLEDGADFVNAKKSD
jgi:hypothetical protein